MTFESLRHQLLIAMPQLEDPNFAHTVTYILEHNENGAMGLMVNRPVNITWDDVLEDMGIEPTERVSAHHQIVLGGPMQNEAGFILHPEHPQRRYGSSIQLQDDLWLTTSRDIIEDIARGEGPSRSLLALGYSGWGAGQLEQELAQNSWLSVPASLEVMFEVPFDMRWHAAARTLGVDMRLMSGQVGHG